MNKGIGCKSRTGTAAVSAEVPDRWRKSVTGETREGRSGVVEHFSGSVSQKTYKRCKGL